MEIVSFTEKYFNPLIVFLRENWSANHSIYGKKMFHWQYGGYTKDFSDSKLLIDDEDNILGFLGTIPYPFLYKGVIKKTASLAIWIVDKSIKNSGIGLYLRKEIEDSFDIVFVIGMNLSTIRYYKKRNYCYHSGLNRYVIPLDAAGYQFFLRDSDFEAEVKEWANSIQYAEPAAPDESICAEVLADVYKSNTVPFFKLLPEKNKDFWSWRYLYNAGFSYFFHHDVGGIVIFRVEDTYAPDDLLRHGIKCLRIIEIIPENGNVWNGNLDKNLVDTILSVLAWAKEQGCVLADFQISNSRLSHILNEIKFKEQLENRPSNIVRIFSPLKFDALPLNFAYRVTDYGSFVNVDREDTYLLKSDSDMDRPNYLG